ncbi:MAG TPA: M23 family metallopeptidase [Candidatus Kapabacteria bacterium]|nr:M23 family metallopeptidase [Candidatus Kapabacteria bacterium]
METIATVHLTKVISPILILAIASWMVVHPPAQGSPVPVGRGGAWVRMHATLHAAAVLRTEPVLHTGPARPKEGRKASALKFLWPTTGRRIVEGYGEQANTQTGTVTLNPGITVSAPKGSAVTASEAGRVSVVSWLPSYGTVVIVLHRGGYRTVYGNLATAIVKRGHVVRPKQRLGTSSGRVHFEVWRGQTRLNPQTVLREG